MRASFISGAWEVAVPPVIITWLVGRRKRGKTLHFNYFTPVIFSHMWHDQGKWVTCRKCQFIFSCTTFSKLQNTSFWWQPHYNWISGYRVMKDLTMLKTIWNKGIWTLFRPISQKQHLRHPTHSSWSCHILSLFCWYLSYRHWVEQTSYTIGPWTCVTENFNRVTSEVLLYTNSGANEVYPPQRRYPFWAPQYVYILKKQLWLHRNK